MKDHSSLCIVGALMFSIAFTLSGIGYIPYALSNSQDILALAA